MLDRSRMRLILPYRQWFWWAMLLDLQFNAVHFPYWKCSSINPATISINYQLFLTILVDCSFLVKQKNYIWTITWQEHTVGLSVGQSHHQVKFHIESHHCNHAHQWILLPEYLKEKFGIDPNFDISKNSNKVVWMWWFGVMLSVIVWWVLMLMHVGDDRGCAGYFVAWLEVEWHKAAWRSKKEPC